MYWELAFVSGCLLWALTQRLRYQVAGPVSKWAPNCLAGISLCSLKKSGVKLTCPIGRAMIEFETVTLTVPTASMPSNTPYSIEQWSKMTFDAVPMLKALFPVSVSMLP